MIVQPRKRRKLAKHIPPEMYSISKRDTEVVELSDIKYEYALLDAHLRLILKDPSLLGTMGERNYVIGSRPSFLTLSHRAPAYAFFGSPKNGSSESIR